MKTTAPIFALTLLGSLALGGSVGALAQQAATNDAASANTGPAEIIAPYDDKLLRLSEVLGSIHYLRNLCKANEGTQWRKVMEDILASETPSEKRKANLISRFNRGYNAFNEVYGHCTASAVVAAERYVKEGVLLSSQITTRYGR
ncbi:MAG: TIGR02301 family protein [Pseudomonadota bacterium]